MGTNRRGSQRVALESAKTNHGNRFSSQFRLARLSLRVDLLFRLSILSPKERAFLLPPRYNRLFSRFCHPHLDHGLGGNLNRCTGSWITPHASFPFHQDQFPDPRKGKGIAGKLFLSSFHAICMGLDLSYGISYNTAEPSILNFYPYHQPLAVFKDPCN